MKSEPYRILEAQLMRSRVSQNMPFQTIDLLINSLDTSLQQSLTRLIIRTKNVSRRTSLDNYILMRCCVTFQYFQSILKDKGEKALLQVCRHLYYSEVAGGNYVYQIGDSADRFFVVMAGEVSVQIPERVVTQNDKGEEVVREGVKEVVRLPVGEVFGESTLRDNAKRAVNTFAITNCEFFEIKKRDYDIIVKYTIMSVMRAKYVFMEEIELFTKISRTNFESLLYLIDQKEVNIGHKLYIEGDPVDYIYVVKSGEFRLQKAMPQKHRKDQLSKLKLKFTKPKKYSVYVVGDREILGDLEMFRGGVRQNTCICITEHARLFRIASKDFAAKVMEDANNDVDGIVEYLYSKDMYMNKRLEQYEKVNEKIESRSQTMGFSLQNVSIPTPQPKFSLNNIVVSRVGNRQYDTDSKTPYRIVKQRKRSIRSNFESSTESIAFKRSTVPFAARLISEIVKQKKKYISLRGTWFANAFDLKPELPTYFRVKMNLNDSSKKCKTENRSQSPSKETADHMFLTSAKTAEPRSRRTRLRVKTQPDIPRQQLKSATPKTVYGKFFQTLLEV